MSADQEEMKQIIFAAITTIIDTSQAIGLILQRHELDSMLSENQLEFINSISLECRNYIDKEQISHGNME